MFSYYWYLRGLAYKCFDIFVCPCTYGTVLNRNDFLVIGVDCPPGMEYQTCSWNISCDEFGVVRDCRNSTCQSGCFCSNGYVLEDGVCVHPDMRTSKLMH